MVAVAVIGSAVVGGVAQGVAGSKAAKAQKKAADQQVEEQRRQYDQTRADYAPWRQTGGSALARLASEYGLSTGATPGNAPVSSQFTASPGYQFRLNEGIKAAERSASARGLLGSGTALKSIQRYGEGLAASEYGDYWNRLAGLAGVGQAATSGTAAAGQNAVNGISQAYQNAGNARASSYANTGSAINSGINNALSAYFYSQGGGFGGGRR